MTNKMTISALVAAVAMTSLAFAEPAPATADTLPAAVETPAEAEESPLTLDASIKYVTAYFFRGYNYGDEGLILQPEATASYEIEVNDNLTITPSFNVWNNVTDQHYSEWDHWDEIDLTPGVDITTGRLTLSLQYIYYHSPAQNWEDIHELGAVVSYDDSEQLGLPIALNPYVGYFQEIVNKGGDEGTYMEIGMEPTWQPEKCPVEFNFPIAVGLGLHEWYFNDEGKQETLGYASGAIVCTYKLNDHLYTNAGVRYIHLIADNVVDGNDGTENQFIGSIGVGYTF